MISCTSQNLKTLCQKVSGTLIALGLVHTCSRAETSASLMENLVELKNVGEEAGGFFPSES